MKKYFFASKETNFHGNVVYETGMSLEPVNRKDLRQYGVVVDSGIRR